MMHYWENVYGNNNDVFYTHANHLGSASWITDVNGDPAILDPRDIYADPAQWEEKAKDLAARFIKNFGKYTTNEAGKALVAAGPQL